MVFYLSKTSKLRIALKFRNYCTIIKTMKGTLAKRTAVQNCRKYSVLCVGEKQRRKEKEKGRQHLEIFLSLCVYIYIYIYTHTYTHMHI